MNSTSLRLIDQKIGKIERREVHDLILELSQATGAMFEEDLTLLNYLNLCFYREGLGKRFTIKPADLNPVGSLKQKVEVFANSPVFTICEELVGSEIELWLENPLYQFLNKRLPPLSRPTHRVRKSPRRDLGGGWVGLSQIR